MIPILKKWVAIITATEISKIKEQLKKSIFLDCLLLGLATIIYAQFSLIGTIKANTVAYRVSEMYT